MEGHYLVGYGDGTGGARADLRLLPASDAADTIAADDGAVSRAWNNVASVVAGYEYPDGMELLATVHFLATQGEGPLDPHTVAQQVANWSERKRRLFPTEDVVQAWHRLERDGMLRQSLGG